MECLVLSPFINTARLATCNGQWLLCISQHQHQCNQHLCKALETSIGHCAWGSLETKIPSAVSAGVQDYNYICETVLDPHTVLSKKGQGEEHVHSLQGQRGRNGPLSFVVYGCLHRSINSAARKGERAHQSSGTVWKPRWPSWAPRPQ